MSAAMSLILMVSLLIMAACRGFPSGSGKDDLASNPGLVAIICIFCVVLTLVLVVVVVKCIRSSSSKFERLEDMPMGSVNEESPFAKYSK
ncbi:putative LOC729966 homolog isoform X2 [Archocentrus centrarchus]|uniref:putative LOC729966 homolog isoform X2 n=1 Tax=Archocentrus centrarchus TaxID=63155 RepID=UPI0011E9B9D4|nr:uncharacterized protein LOC115779469 isoform X2 [Archocentrus centrarchus]